MLTIERISGEGFLRFSGIGTGSFGRRLSFLVETGLISIVSEKDKKYFIMQIMIVKETLNAINYSSKII